MKKAFIGASLKVCMKLVKANYIAANARQEFIFTLVKG